MIPRVGDVLRVSCPQAPTHVTEVNRFYVSVRSPWWRIDPDVHWIRWNGDLALSRDRSHQEWQEELLRSVPPADQVREGDRCTLGIPDTVVHVTDIRTPAHRVHGDWNPLTAVHHLAALSQVAHYFRDWKGRHIFPTAAGP